MKRASSFDELRGALRRGSVAAVVGLGLIPLVAVAALAVDGGLAMTEEMHAQAVADSSALAAAYLSSLNVSNPSGAATQYAAANGYSNDGATSAVTVNIPPTSGSFSGKSGYVEVIATKYQTPFFSGLWGSGAMAISGRTVAVGMTTAYSKAAILVLAKTGTSVTLSGTTTITDVGGPIIVDSTSSASIVSSGSPSITAPTLDLSGGIQFSGANPDKATVTNTNQPYTPDPLANLPVPSPTGMPVGSSSAITMSGSQTRTLTPGVYTGGISLSGSASVTLSPGMYYIKGGGFTTSGLSSVSGNGVFIYNTGGGTINLSGTGGIKLTPMTTGTYTGLTIFQDRSSTVGATMSGGTNVSNTGTFYFPSATITLSGTSGIAVMGDQFIANNLAFSGSSGVKVAYGPAVASATTVRIVE